MWKITLDGATPPIMSLSSHSVQCLHLASALVLQVLLQLFHGFIHLLKEEKQPQTSIHLLLLTALSGLDTETAMSPWQTRCVCSTCCQMFVLTG